jgi:hypothetical protein
MVLWLGFEEYELKFGGLSFFPSSNIMGFNDIVHHK